ncbi:aromatic ring-hydroxylating dioxygenase subunit alpha [Aurantiacibacter suaedae]|uniref:aromatic ring-hydroxylating dioxygenase subunit alpha n=1 Tax=Aurantiacibacter suaedae TaxID=2545755 RepID=UPI0010F5B310|nr:aromatic ring-hydroxylating dioxygenase subunit alpha [Aurantiacibacter suaedae]
MFPKNAWYVAAISREIKDRGVLSRTICELPLALYRAQDGTVGALLDRCPHRLFPLSKGQVTQDGLRCGYHGLAFAADGRCTHIPSQDEIPPNARVAAYPVRESHGLIWLWPGDPALAQNTPLPAFETGPGYLSGLDFSCLDECDKWGVAGPHLIEVDANYMLAVDNLLDLTHVAFIHAKTFDNSAILGSERITKTLGANQLIDFFRFKNPMSAPLRAAYMLDQDIPLYDSFLETYWHAPGTMILVHGATPERADREESGTIVMGINAITPATRTSCHYFWSQAVYRNLRGGAVRDAWEIATRNAFAEDEHALRTQQHNLERFGMQELSDGVSLMLKSDKAITLARRTIARLVKEETTGSRLNSSRDRQ